MKELLKNNNQLLILLCLCFFGCKPHHKPIAPEQLQSVVFLNNEEKEDTIYGWRADDLKAYPKKDGLFDYTLDDLTLLRDVRKNFKIENGILYNDSKKLEGKINILFQYSENKRWLIKTDDGKIREVYNQENFKEWDYQLFNDLGNLDMHGFIESSIYLKTYKEGSGIWENFYQTNIVSKKDLILKEKGHLKNNFKYGKWKYYNKEGEIDSTRVYKLHDSVDVRFPHCIFNKTEPCY